MLLLIAYCSYLVHLLSKELPPHHRKGSGTVIIFALFGS
nr:MAG TPA: hypothetical protein [Caudoviricetes sp.]